MGVTLLQVRFVEHLPADVARTVLQGYQGRYGALRGRGHRDHADVRRQPPGRVRRGRPAHRAGLRPRRSLALTWPPEHDDPCMNDVLGIRGLGTDLVEIERFRQALARRASLPDRLFTDGRAGVRVRSARPGAQPRRPLRRQGGGHEGAGCRPRCVRVPRRGGGARRRAARRRSRCTARPPRSRPSAACGPGSSRSRTPTPPRWRWCSRWAEEHAMEPVLTPEAMNEADRRTIAAGTPVDVLMDRAGRAVAWEVRRVAHGTYGQRVVLVCGKGNNGGDGLVAARVLAGWGMRTRVFELAERHRPRRVDACAGPTPTWPSTRCSAPGSAGRWRATPRSSPSSWPHGTAPRSRSTSRRASTVSRGAGPGNHRARHPHRDLRRSQARSGVRARTFVRRRGRGHRHRDRPRARAAPRSGDRRRRRARGSRAGRPTRTSGGRG